MAGIDELASALDGESDRDLAELIEGPDSSNRTTIHVYFGHLCEGCSVLNEYVPSLVADVLSMTIRDKVAISRSSTLEVRSVALELTLSFHSICIGELESQLASKNFEV